MITFRHSGNFEKLTKFLNNARKAGKVDILDKYGDEGVSALASATPVETGKTASSWSYKIVREKDHISIQFLNSNINDGVPIAVILQYGHATRNGGWVEGRDYINPAIQPIFDRIANDAWKEVIR